MTKDYCQGIEYKDGKVEAVYGHEGRLTAVYDEYGVTLTRFRAEYWLKDHLGNTRLAFADENHNGAIEVWDDPSTPENEAEIVQENHYYPFGMNHEGPWYGTIGPRNGYQYNGKELNEELDLDWNDFGARWQDPATGRWWQVDPLGEEYHEISPYVYTANNPILYIDPDGRRLIITFENLEAQELYQYIVNNMFEGQFKLDFQAIKNEKNKFEVSVVAINGKGEYKKLSQNAKAFYDEFTNVTENKSFIADMSVVIDDPTIDIGNYKNNILDVGDIIALPSHDLCNIQQCGPTQGGKIIHETVEQFAKGVDGIKRGSDIGFIPNHERGLNAENDVNKNNRGIDTWGGGNASIQRYTSDTYGSTKWEIRYGRKKGQRTQINRVK